MQLHNREILLFTFYAHDPDCISTFSIDCNFGYVKEYQDFICISHFVKFKFSFSSYMCPWKLTASLRSQLEAFEIHMLSIWVDFHDVWIITQPLLVLKILWSFPRDLTISPIFNCITWSMTRNPFQVSQWQNKIQLYLLVHFFL